MPTVVCAPPAAARSRVATMAIPVASRPRYRITIAPSCSVDKSPGRCLHQDGPHGIRWLTILSRGFLSNSRILPTVITTDEEASPQPWILLGMMHESSAAPASMARDLTRPNGPVSIVHEALGQHSGSEQVSQSAGLVRHMEPDRTRGRTRDVAALCRRRRADNRRESACAWPSASLVGRDHCPCTVRSTRSTSTTRSRRSRSF